MIMKALNLNPRKESPVREKAKRSFIRAFGRATAIVLISSGLMVGCAGNNSNVRSDSGQQVAKTESSSRESYRKIAEKAAEIQRYHEEEMELINERERLIKERDEARAKKEAAEKREREKCNQMFTLLSEEQRDCETDGCDDNTLKQLKKYWGEYYEMCSEFVAGIGRQVK